MPSLKLVRNWLESHTPVTTLGEAQVKMLLTIVCRLLECYRFTDFLKLQNTGQAVSDTQIAELHTETEAKVVGEMKKLYEEALKNGLVLQDAETWEKTSQRLRPPPIGEAVKAAEQANAAQPYNPNTADRGTDESRGTAARQTADPVEDSAFLAGQAAPRR